MTNPPCAGSQPGDAQQAVVDGHVNPNPMKSAAEHPNAELVVQRFMLDVLGRGAVDQISELVAPDYVGHLGHGDYYGPEGVRIEIATYRSAFPDLTVRLSGLIACGNYVVRRFTIVGTHVAPFIGHHPTGERVMVRGIGIDRVAKGQLQESWVLVEVAPRAPPLDSWPSA